MSKNCKKIAHLIDKKDTEQLPLRQAIFLQVHLLYCRLCRNYSIFSANLKGLFANIKKQNLSLSELQKQKLKNKLNKVDKNEKGTDII